MLLGGCMPSRRPLMSQNETADNFIYRAVVCLGMLTKWKAISVRRQFENTRAIRPWANSTVSNELGACSCLHYVISLSVSRMPADSKCLSKVTASFFPLQPLLLAVGLRAQFTQRLAFMHFYVQSFRWNDKWPGSFRLETESVSWE